MGGAKRYPSTARQVMMGIALLHPSYETRRANQRPSGKILSSPRAKNIPPSAVGQITGLTTPVSPERGACARHERCGGMRWTRRLRLTSVADAYGEGVWFWRPDAGVKFCGSASILADRARYPRSDGGKKAGHQEERAISRKTIARGRPECFR